MDYYVKIDEKQYLSTGEVVVSGQPKSLVELFDDEFEKMPDKGFRIHRPDVFCRFIEAVGGKRGKVAAYILKNKSPRNALITRISDVAENTGVSMQTANDTFRLLRESNSIKTVIGALMVNPGVDHSGNREREAFLMKMYETFEYKKPGEIAKEESEAPSDEDN